MAKDTMEKARMLQVLLADADLTNRIMLAGSSVIVGMEGDVPITLNVATALCVLAKNIEQLTARIRALEAKDKEE